MHGRVLAALTAIAMLATFAPSAASQPSPPPALPAGSFVVLGDADWAPVLTNAGLAIGLCAIDGDGDGAYDAGEVIIVDVDLATCGSTEVSDVRLLSSGGMPAGSLIRTSDPDFNLPLIDLEVNAGAVGVTEDDLQMYDANGNRVLDLGDTLYVDIANPAGDRVDVGDLRLSPYGTLGPGGVLAGHADVNFALSELSTARDMEEANALLYFDRNQNSRFDGNDTLYANPDGPEIFGALGFDVPATADLRLTAFGDLPFGSMVSGLHPDVVRAYRVPGVAGAITGNLCGIDNDGDGAYDAGEPLLFDVDAACVTNTEASDLRLTASAGKPAGSLISVGDGDFNAPVLNLAATDNLEYDDADGNGVFNAGDTMYIDIRNDGTNRVDVGDLRLTARGALPAPASVKAGDADVNAALGVVGLPAGLETADANVLAFLDAQNDASFNAGDVAYINVNAGGFPEQVAVNDIRVMPFLDIYAAGSVAGPADIDVTQALSDIVNVSLCAVDGDGDGAYDAGEQLILDRNAADCDGQRTTAGDIRLLGRGDKAAGTLIAMGDIDYDIPLEANGVGDNIEFFDADGDGLLSAADTVYIDVVSDANNRVDVGDLRLTRYGSLAALMSVKAGDGDINLGLAQDLNGAAANPANGWDIGLTNGDAAATVDLLGFFDVDGDGTLTRGDFVYVNTNAGSIPDESPEVLDVRLTAVALAMGAPPAPPPVQPPPVGGEPAPPPAPGSVDAQLQALVGQLATLQGQLNSSSAQNAQLSQQVSSLSSQLSQQSQQLGSLQGQLADAQKQNTDLKAKLAEADKKGAPGFEGLAALAALGVALLALRRR